MKKIFLLILLLSMVLTLNSAMAADSSPYLTGIYYVENYTSDSDLFETEIANPTNITLQVEVAFYDDNGNFCTCDEDTMAPNSLWKFDAGDYRTNILNHCGDGRGLMKVIGHVPCRNSTWNCTQTTFTNLSDTAGPTLTGFNTMKRHGNSRSAGMAGVTLNAATKMDMYNIYINCRNSLQY